MNGENALLLNEQHPKFSKKSSSELLSQGLYIALKKWLLLVWARKYTDSIHTLSSLARKILELFYPFHPIQSQCQVNKAFVCISTLAAQRKITSSTYKNSGQHSDLER
jgi:hypothetical protein